MQVVFAKFDAGVTTPDGGFSMVRMGEHRHPADPVVKARPDVFSPDPRYGLVWYGTPPAELADPPDEVEAATAGPGERRNTRRG
jgi:hypothetical protein